MLTLAIARLVVDSIATNDDCIYATEVHTVILHSCAIFGVRVETGAYLTVIIIITVAFPFNDERLTNETISNLRCNSKSQ